MVKTLTHLHDEGAENNQKHLRRANELFSRAPFQRTTWKITKILKTRIKINGN